MKDKSITVSPVYSSDESAEFCANVIEKIRLIAEREDRLGDEEPIKVANSNMRVSVGNVLEAFQQEIIRRNIWIRIYDDHPGDLPSFHPKACGAIAEVIKDALRRHQTNHMQAYVEISFLVNETGTVVTIEDNALSLSVDELRGVLFLQEQRINELKGGYTVQASINDTETGTTLGQASVRCVTNCFTRFTACFPH